MDTTLIATANAIQQSKIQTQIDYAVLGKSQQVERQQGQAAVALIEQAAQLQQQLDQGSLDVTL